MSDEPDAGLRRAIAPRSIAIVGASDDPDKPGGRPVHYLRTFGYAGAVYAVNPRRETVQGLPCFATLDALPQVPDLVVVAVAGAAAAQAVRDAVRRGVRAVMVIASGFGEVDATGARAEQALAGVARAAGACLIGPNTQGFANFATAAVSSFSTIFGEHPPQDGPVAVVSQSGAMAAALYGLLRVEGIGVRYVLATGNEAGVDAAQVTRALVRDETIELVLLYLEQVADASGLAQAAALAREHGVRIVAVKAGRTPAGQRMAASHTGALASEDRVVDAFLRRHGIWRAPDLHDMTRSAPMYLRGWVPRGNRLVVISGSGGSCVMAADAAGAAGLTLARPAPSTCAAIRAALPTFATSTNPIDLTAALLTDNGLLEAVLATLADEPAVDLVLFDIPVMGRGYDVERLAAAAAGFSRRSGKPLAVAAWQPRIAQTFAAAGVPTYTRAVDALRALAQLAGHAALLRRAPPAWAGAPPEVDVADGTGVVLDEARSLALLAQAGLPVVRHRLCRTAAEAAEAFTALGAPVVVKACSRDVPHKSEHGLVALGIGSAAEARDAFARHTARLAALGAACEGAIVAATAVGYRELMLGAHVDPTFGPVVMVGDGGRDVETLGDTALLVPPFDAAEVVAALRGLRIGPIVDGVRGDPPLDVEAYATAAIALGRLIAAHADRIASIDVNPLVCGGRGQGVVAVDALVGLREARSR